jgi:hypothetical protein
MKPAPSNEEVAHGSVMLVTALLAGHDENENVYVYLSSRRKS